MNDNLQQKFYLCKANYILKASKPIYNPLIITI